MSNTGQIHWHEGLFLQPHHLQTMQRYLLDRYAQERTLAWPYPYGVVDAKLSSDALENLVVQFDRLHVIMPSGVEVLMPEDADVPAMNIKQPFETGGGGFTILLGVPLWYASRGNVVEPGNKDAWMIKRLYHTVEIERPDENTGENPQPVLVRRVNARLLLETDDRSDMEVLPLLRIAHAAGEEVGLPRQDLSFVPATLVLPGSPVLRDLVRDLASQVEASRKELLIQLTRGGFAIDTMRGVQFEQVLRLQTLNRFAGRLPAMVKAPAVTPFEMYLELRDLLGELSALYPDRDAFDAPDYDHDNPILVFKDLVSRIRSLLRGAVAPSFISVQFVREGSILVAALENKHISGPNQYFLGVTTGQDPRAVARLIENADEFKLMAKSMAGSRVWGVKLVEERHPPLELPAQVNLHYFALQRDQSARMWERICQEKAIAARWPDLESSDFKLTLYMTVPGEGGKA
ncbi:MAG: type VI secretion system baseplate subunit TssK [Phycisphaerae bacterium]